jgi:PGF-CTERM protein
MKTSSFTTRNISIVTVSALLLLAVGGGVVSAQVPGLPAQYYGNLSVVDEEVEQPVQIEVIADGEVEQTFTTRDDGSFGGPTRSDNKIEIQPPEEDTIEFHIGGEQVDSTQFEGGTQEIEIVAQPEDIEPNLELTVEETNAPIDAEEELEVNVTVDNAGPSRAVRDLELLDYEGSVVATQEQTVDIEGTATSTLTWETDTEDSGERAITVQYGDLSTSQNVTIEEPPEEEETGNEGGGSGGGGGGGGAGTGGGGSDTETGPATIQDVRDTAGLIEPTTNSETPLADAAPETPGITVEPAAADSVQRITFNNEALTGTVPITEYDSPPQTLVDNIIESANADIEGLENNTVNVIFVTDISPTVNATEDSSATVELVVDRSEVDDPSQLTVIKESYSQETQSDEWRQLETSIVEKTDQEVIIEAEVDAFSLFTVAEITETDGSGETGENQNNATEDDDSTNEGLPGFGTVTALIALVAAGFVAYRKRE